MGADDLSLGIFCARRLNEGVKIALLLKMTPEPLRQNLHLQGHTKHGVARAAVVNALLSQHFWQNTPEPMEVGEIGGKRPHKGKAKGKGKQKHKPQSKQQDKDYSDCQCHNCGKMGHISSQCWSKFRKGKGKGKDKTVSAVQASTSASSASDVGSIGAGSAPGSMIASLVKNPIIHETATCGHDKMRDGFSQLSLRSEMLRWNTLYETAIDAFHEVLVDSGAERCVCHPFWARDAPHVTQLNPCLVTTSGEPLDHFGCRRVNLGFARSPARLKVTILNVRRPILSLGSLLKHGHDVIFDRANPHLLLRDESTNAVHRFPMEARGNTFVVLGRSVSSMLAPVIKERVAVPVMPAVPVLPGDPHEDRAVLEQALDDQPVELARGFANPNRPDEETVERHNLTHLPAAAWCDICVRSRGRDAPHREAAAAEIDAVRPVIEMLNRGCPISHTTTSKHWLPLIVPRVPFVILESCKKVMMGGHNLSVWIASLGYIMVTHHSDKESAICWVRDRVQANLTERGMSVTTRASPTHSHESNGGAERAVQSVRGLARTLVAQVEDRTGLIFGADSPLCLWAFRHAGWILTRFVRRRDTGMTPHAKLFCKQYRQPLQMLRKQ